MSSEFLDDKVQVRLQEMEYENPSLSFMEDRTLSPQELINRADSRIPIIGYQYLSIDEYLASLNDYNDALRSSDSRTAYQYRRLLLRTAIVADHTKKKHSAGFVYDMLNLLKGGEVSEQMMSGWILNGYFAPRTEIFNAVAEGYPKYRGLLIMKLIRNPYEHLQL